MKLAAVVLVLMLGLPGTVISRPPACFPIRPSRAPLPVDVKAAEVRSEGPLVWVLLAYHNPTATPLHLGLPAVGECLYAACGRCPHDLHPAANGGDRLWVRSPELAHAGTGWAGQSGVPFPCQRPRRPCSQAVHLHECTAGAA